MRRAIPVAVLCTLAISGQAFPGTSHDAQTDVVCKQQLNQALVFRVRGSGDGYGTKDSLDAWDRAATGILRRAGWEVQHVEARYDAPAVPGTPNPLAWKRFRDVASRQSPQVRAQLIASVC